MERVRFVLMTWVTCESSDGLAIRSPQLACRNVKKKDAFHAT